MNKPHVKKHTRHFLTVAEEVFSDNVNEVDNEKHLSEENEEIYNSDFGFENFSEISCESAPAPPACTVGTS